MKMLQLIVCTLVAFIIVGCGQNDSPVARKEFSLDRIVEYWGNDESGRVTSCEAFPTNNPVVFVAQAIVKDYENGHEYPRIGYTPTPLTNGQPIIARSIKILEANGGKKVTFFFPDTSK